MKGQRRLFTVYSVVDGFRHRERIYDNLSLLWLVTDRQKPLVRLRDDLDNCSLQGFLNTNTRFSHVEAKALKAYLDRNHAGYTKTNIKLEPIPSWDTFQKGKMLALQPYREGIYNLWEEPGYDLPFKVTAYFIFGRNEGRTDGPSHINNQCKTRPWMRFRNRSTR